MEPDRRLHDRRDERRSRIRRFADLPPTIFHSDPQSVEVVSGYYISVLAFWCWLAGSFGTFLPKLANLHGYEWMVAVLLCPYGIYHSLGAHSHSLKRRSIRAFILSVAFCFLGTVLMLNQSWRVWGVPALFLAAFIQGWVFLRLQRVIP